MPQVKTDYIIVYQALDNIICSTYTISTSSPITAKLIKSLEMQIAHEKCLSGVTIVNIIECEREVEE